MQSGQMEKISNTINYLSDKISKLLNCMNHYALF